MVYTIKSIGKEVLCRCRGNEPCHGSTSSVIADWLSGKYFNNGSDPPPARPLGCRHPHCNDHIELGKEKGGAKKEFGGIETGASPGLVEMI
jgi:hypothetical protein